MSDLIAHQWGRLGDLIQTGVVLSRWKSQTSGRVALTYDSRYQAVVERMSCVDDGFPLDLSRIVGDSRSERECETILTIEQALNGMQSLCGGVHLVLNRSNSVALLSHLLKPEVSIGYRWDNGQLRTPAILADWLNGPDENPYPAHVCDTWSQMAGLSCDSIPGDVLFGKKANRKTDPKAFRILLVADAGETYRTLPTPWLAGLCRELLKLPQLHITAVGSKTGNGMDKLNSLAASNEYQFEDLRGRTTLMELISLCERHDAAIGPDTGGLHLAAACGCFPIGLYSGGASVFNTGPYSARACVLQNPEWTEAEIKSLRDAVAALAENSIENHIPRGTVSFWMPCLDEFGLCYTHPEWNTHSKTTVSRLRKELHSKWLAEKNTLGLQQAEP